MAGTSSNTPEMVGLLGQLGSLIDFTSAGKGASLAKDLRGLIATEIAGRTVDEQRGAGGPWADNAARYARSPKKAGRPVGVLSGQMVSHEELMGEAEVGPDSLAMTYGVSAAARDKLTWFSTGSDGPDGERSGAKGQPARPGLYELDDPIDAAIDDFIDRWLDRRLAEWGA